MKQRGKKSTKLAVVNEAPITAIDRPEPPRELTPEQRIEWMQVVNAVRADWFGQETLALLTQYCKHVVTARHIGELVTRLEAEKEIDVQDYERLLKMQERETRIIASCMTRMRLTQQSTYNAQKTKGQAKVKSPWDQ